MCRSSVRRRKGKEERGGEQEGGLMPAFLCYISRAGAVSGRNAFQVGIKNGVAIGPALYYIE